MILHKTSGPVTPERPVKNSPAKPVSQATVSSPAAQTATPAAKPFATPSAKPPSAPLSVAALVAGAGLPSDKLSASVVAFARFFSLPLKPELLAAIRRQGVAPQPHLAKTATPPAPAAQALTEPNAAREAFSLAAAAAESKGVKLNAAGLEAYAAAVDPDLRERDRGKGGRERRDENPDDAEKEKADSKVPPSASGLRETVLESAEKTDLLAVLNRLPGKDGRRWIVLPFTYTSGGRELSVSMRVLLEGDTPGTIRACRMVLDIAGQEGENGETEGRRVFVAESADCISLQNSGENFPCERGYDGCGDGLLLSIDEMV
jgi:hypothetical protein